MNAICARIFCGSGTFSEFETQTMESDAIWFVYLIMWEATFNTLSICFDFNPVKASFKPEIDCYPRRLWKLVQVCRCI